MSHKLFYNSRFVRQGSLAELTRFVETHYIVREVESDGQTYWVQDIDGGSVMARVEIRRVVCVEHIPLVVTEEELSRGAFHGA